MLLALTVPCAALGATGTPAAPTAGAVDIEVFTRTDCPRCTAAARFLDDVQRQRPGLRITVVDVQRDPQALQRLRALATQQRIGAMGVPAFLVDGELIVGFSGDDTTGARLRHLLDRRAAPSGDTFAGAACTVEDAAACAAAPSGVRPAADAAVALPLLGPLDWQWLGLPLFTVVLGLLDGFNPCAMWVLLFVLSLLVNVGNRGKMLLIGGTFVVVSGVAYLAFMAAWLNVFLLIGLARATQVVLGAVAVVVGMIHLKDFVAFGRGISLSIPASAKPTLYARIRAIVLADNLVGALLATITLAVLVNTVELLCTAGLPAVYTQILALRPLPRWQHYGYLILYNVAYMFDDTVMLAIAVVTLGRRKLQERGGRWLKLVSGAVMLVLGLVLLVKPEWLAAY